MTIRSARGDTVTTWVLTSSHCKDEVFLEKNLTNPQFSFFDAKFFELIIIWLKKRILNIENVHFTDLKVLSSEMDPAEIRLIR